MDVTSLSSYCRCIHWQHRLFQVQMTLPGLFGRLAVKPVVLGIKSLLGCWQVGTWRQCKYMLSNQRDKHPATASKSQRGFLNVWYKMYWTGGTMHELDSLSSKMPLAAWWHFTKQSYLINFAQLILAYMVPLLAFPLNHSDVSKWAELIFFFSSPPAAAIPLLQKKKKSILWIT